MSEHLDVDPQVLLDAAAGINAITGALTELGIGETASVGRGFANLTLSTTEAGHHGVQRSLEEFAERWSWGVRALVKAANSIADTLDLSAGLYYSIEQANAGTVKTAWTNAFGDPRMNSDDAGSRSWGETFADNPANSILNSDYSAQSFGEAANTVTTNLGASGRDIVDIATAGTP